MYSFITTLMLHIALVSWMHIRAYQRNQELSRKSHQLDQLPALCKHHIINFTDLKDIPLGNFLITMGTRNYHIVEETPKKRTLKTYLDDDFCKKHSNTIHLISTISHDNHWYAMIYKQKKSTNVVMMVINLKNKLLSYKHYFSDSFKQCDDSPSLFTDLHFIGNKTLFCLYANRLYRLSIYKDFIGLQKIYDKDPQTKTLVDLDVISMVADQTAPIAFILKNKKIPLTYDICAVNLLTKRYKKIEEFKSDRLTEHYIPYRLSYANNLLTLHTKNAILPINKQIFTIPLSVYKI